MNLYVFTEDSGEKSVRVVQHLVLHMLRLVDGAFDKAQVNFPGVRLTRHPRGGRVTDANGWKNPRHLGLPELIRKLAEAVLEPDAFVFFHLDADCVWSAVHQERGSAKVEASENWSKFEEVVVDKVLIELSGRLPYASARHAVREKLFRLIPFQAVEAWLFQHLARVEEISLDRYEAADAGLFAAWSADRAQIDDFEDPKENICLGQKHNLELAEDSGYPARRAYDARRSFWWCVKQMEGSWALHRALARARP